MEDALRLFTSVVNSPWFEETLFMLVFNKKDLFLDKMQRQRIPITACPAFEAYDGEPQSFQETTLFIRDRFTATITGQERAPNWGQKQNDNDNDNFKTFTRTNKQINTMRTGEEQDNPAQHITERE